MLHRPAAIGTVAVMIAMLIRYSEGEASREPIRNPRLPRVLSVERSHEQPRAPNYA